MILLFSRDLIHKPLKTMESLPFASIGCASARFAVLLVKYTFKTWKPSLRPVRRGTPQHQAPRAAPCWFLSHPGASVRHKDHESPLFAALILERFQLSHIKPSPTVNHSPAGYPKEHLSGLSPAWPSAVGPRERGLCALLGTEWLGEHHGHLSASLESFIKAFVEIHRRIKIKPSKFCYCCSLLSC